MRRTTVQHTWRTVKDGRKRWTAAVLTAAALATVSCISARPIGAADQQTVSAASGRIAYDTYCTPCHGPGGAPGSAVFDGTKQPVDLRTYVQRHGGTFPSGDWLSVVFAQTPHNPHTAIWERVRRDETAAGGTETTARGKVRAIADYIVSIQAR
jgi:mono/diheme cytochrome c family protein